MEECSYRIWTFEKRQKKELGRAYCRKDGAGEIGATSILQRGQRQPSSESYTADVHDAKAYCSYHGLRGMLRSRGIALWALLVYVLETR
jgi:hypothetical protein